MKPTCVSCGVELVLGRIVPSGVEILSEPCLSFVLSRGVPTSRNLLEAVRQGLRGDPDPVERHFPVRAGACPRCGRLELFAEVGAWCDEPQPGGPEEAGG